MSDGTLKEESKKYKLLSSSDVLVIEIRERSWESLRNSLSGTYSY